MSVPNPCDPPGCAAWRRPHWSWSPTGLIVVTALRNRATPPTKRRARKRKKASEKKPSSYFCTGKKRETPHVSTYFPLYWSHFTVQYPVAVPGATCAFLPRSTPLRQATVTVHQTHTHHPTPPVTSSAENHLSSHPIPGPGVYLSTHPSGELHLALTFSHFAYCSLVPFFIYFIISSLFFSPSNEEFGRAIPSIPPFPATLPSSHNPFLFLRFALRLPYLIPKVSLTIFGPTAAYLFFSPSPTLLFWAPSSVATHPGHLISAHQAKQYCNWLSGPSIAYGHPLLLAPALTPSLHLTIDYLPLRP